MRSGAFAVKKLLSIIIAALMLMSTLMSVASIAATASESASMPELDYSDLPDGWSREAVLAAIGNGLLQGYDGKIDPQGNLTRAQMAAILVRAFGATKEADAVVMAQFTDADPNAWYYRELSVAVNVGLFLGDGTGAIRPDDNTTREEVAVVLARAFYLLDVEMYMSGFIDAGEMSDWARDSIAALAKSGKMNGYEDGTLRPKSLITREEFAQLMHNIVELYITEPGEYTFVVSGSVIVRSGGVILKDCVIGGDLILGYDLAAEDAVFENVQVRGRSIVHSTAQIFDGDTPLGAPGADAGDGDGDVGTPSTGDGEGEGGEAPVSTTPPSTPGTSGASTYTLNISVSSQPQVVSTQKQSGLPGLSADGLDGLFYLIVRDHMRANVSYIKSQISPESDSTGLFGPLFSIFGSDVSISDVAGMTELMQYVTVAPGSAVSASAIKNPYIFLGDMVGTTTLVFSDAPLYNEARFEVGREAGGYTLQITFTVSIDNMPIASTGHSGSERLYGGIFDAVEAELGERFESYGLDGMLAASEYVGEVEAWFYALTPAELDRWLTVTNGDRTLLGNKDVTVGEVNGFTFALNYANMLVKASIRLVG
jgi:hypothetical protein